MPPETPSTLSKFASSDGEFAAKVIAGGDAGQDLHGAKGIVREHAAKILQFSAAEDLRRRDRIGRRAEDVRRDRHGLGVRGGPFVQPDRQRRAAGGHVAPEQRIPHHRHVEPMRTRREAVDLESPAGVRQNRLPQILDDHQHLFERRPGPTVHDLASQSPCVPGL